MKPKLIEIYNKKRIYEAAKNNLQKDTNLLEPNKKLILDFAENCIARSVTLTRAAKYIYLYRSIGKHIKDMKNATRKDLEQYLSQLEKSDYTEATKKDFKSALKQMYKWLEAEKTGRPMNQMKDPPLTDWFTCHVKKQQTKFPEQMLTEEEILKLILAANNTKEKALISTLL